MSQRPTDDKPFDCDVEAGNKARAIFISHRHDDHEIAHVLKEAVLDWTSGNVDVFMSSDARSAPRVGEPLPDELKRSLSRSEVVLLVYTYADQDWSYAMWECGVATDPRTDGSRVVVFQCTEDEPRVFGNEVRVPLTEIGIGCFTRQFHTASDFFPGFDVPLCPNVLEETLRDRTKQLLEKLRKVTPGPKREIRRWDYLRLALPVSSVKEIFEKTTWNEALALAMHVIDEECLVVDSFGDATKHFGYDSLGENVKFKQLAELWERLSDCEAPKWMVSVYEEMTRAIKNHCAEPSWNLLKSVRKDTNWWFAPIINHVRVVPEHRRWEFDLYLYRVPVNGDGQLPLSMDKSEAVIA